ncbi:MAG: hypothetical protein M9911_05080 [Saprospiraceae bacterium]|jgi:hypothetical protein|nr:hypothetical protein [Saprospiraceae bacterium]
MTSLFYPSISPEAGEPNNEVIPSKECKYQLKNQILSGIKYERGICYTHLFSNKTAQFQIFFNFVH